MKIKPGMTWQEMGMTSPPVPNASILHCGLCGLEVHRTLPDDLRYPELIADEAEAACEIHLTRHHPWRYRLWKRLRWDWLVRGIAP